MDEKYRKIIYSLLIILGTMTLLSFILSLSIKFYFPQIIFFKSLGFEVVQNTFFAKNATFVINNFCTGLFSIALFLSIIFSPITKRKKPIFILLGIIILYLLNFVRIYLMVILPFNANILHTIGWFFMSAIIFSLWFVSEKY